MLTFENRLAFEQVDQICLSINNFPRMLLSLTKVNTSTTLLLLLQFNGCSLLIMKEPEMTEMDGKPHVLGLPYPAEGHINPMLQFAKRLTSKGLRFTLILATSTSITFNAEEIGLLNIEHISDGSENGEPVNSIDGYFNRMKIAISRNLAELIEIVNKSKYPAKVLVYDSTLPWALDVAQEHGLLGASFFTQCCAVNWIYYHVHKGVLKIPPDEAIVSIPPLPLLEANEMPLFNHVMDSNKTLVKFIANQFSNLQKVNWILFNTCDNLEKEVISWMARQWPIKTIGPTIQKENRSDGTYQLNANSEASIKWLEKRDLCSVVYVSYGTVIELVEEQMEEIARGLASSGCYFLWVIRTSQESKLPANFRSEVSEKGLILNWCPQLEVLMHPALACFITHCGWNSTLEGLSSGVPLIAMPHRTDQILNAKFIADVWQIGVRVKANDRGIVTREEIEMRIREVTQSEKGNELKKSALKWKQKVEEATAPGGTSDKNIEDFVSQV